MEEFMENGYTSSLKGQFIIAMPGLLDPNFYQSVTCICEHNTEGALGLIINRLHPSLTCSDLFKELDLPVHADIENTPVYIGGPVHSNEIFILHGPPFDWQGCYHITDTLAMSNTGDVLKAIGEGKGPKNAIVALGCSGWGPEQIEAEMKQNAWLNCPISEEIIFDVDAEQRWNAAVKKVGIDPKWFSGTAGHA
jgi:putative transcriptional regulator